MLDLDIVTVMHNYVTRNTYGTIIAGKSDYYYSKNSKLVGNGRIKMVSQTFCRQRSSSPTEEISLVETFDLPLQYIIVVFIAE